MKSEQRKELKDLALAVAAIVCLYSAFWLLGIGCPIKFLTGISCLGCGMTRAWLSLIRLDFKSAFFYHPGFWIPPLMLPLFLWKNKKFNKVYYFFIFTAIILFVIIYCVRLSRANDTIVVFQPENGILWLILKKIIQ